MGISGETELKKVLLLLRGRYEHTMDTKGRLTIPSRFKSELNENQIDPYIVTNFGNCLSVYPMDQWIILEEKLAKLPQFDKSVIAFQRYFIASALECSLDKQGRILIPPYLRKIADIEKDCILLGRLNKFEIWAKEKWEKEFLELKNNFDDITLKMANSGIEL